MASNPPTIVILRIYYAATAIFLLLDYVLGINIRLASLQPFPGWRALYYVFCFACLAVIMWRPAYSLLVTTVESLLTLAMLIISMAVRVMTVSDTMISTGVGIVRSEEIVNFLLAGGAAWIAYMRGAKALQKNLRKG